MVKEKQVKVSVIIPVYNTEQYVGKCLDSILNQTLKEIQILCVNDGSTDRSGEILKEYAQKDSRVRVTEQINQGQATARNSALAVAEGEYCTFVDSDDWLEADALLNLYYQATEEHLDVLYFAGETEYDTEELAKHHEPYFDRAYHRDKIPEDPVSGREMLQRQLEAGQYWRSACLCLIRSQFLKAAGIRFREGIRYEDNLFAYLLCLRAERVASVPEQYYRRLLRENSTITVGRTAQDLYGYITSVTDEISLMKETAGKYEDNTAFYTVIDDTIKRAFNVWKSLNEEERKQIEPYFRSEVCNVCEKDLYYSLFLSRFREEEERQRLLEKNEELRQQLKKAKIKQEELQQEKQEIYDSSSYRIGNTLLVPARKVGKILHPRQKTEGKK